jgi:hypothetical protein
MMLGFRAFLGLTVDDDPANRRAALLKVDVLPLQTHGFARSSRR